MRDNNGWEVIFRLITVIGLVATVFMCVLVTLTFIAPQRVTQIIYQITETTPEVVNVPLVQTIVSTVTDRDLTPIIPTAILATAELPNTPAPAPITTPNIIQPEGFIFFDDFEDGIAREWEVDPNKIGMANGMMTIIEALNGRANQHFAVLGDHYWGNVEVTVQVASFKNTGFLCGYPCFGGSYGAIIIRQQGYQEVIGFFLHPTNYGQMYFAKYINGDWEIIQGTLVESSEVGVPFYNDAGVEIAVTAIGNTYRAFINGQEISSISIPGPSTGQVGLWFRTSDTNGNIGHYAPRFEEITVKSLP